MIHNLELTPKKQQVQRRTVGIKGSSKRKFWHENPRRALSGSSLEGRPILWPKLPLSSAPKLPAKTGDAFRITGTGYGSIPINTIFRGMNIHLPAILMFTRGTRVLTHNQVSTSCVEGWEGIGDVTRTILNHSGNAILTVGNGAGARNSSATTAATEKIGRRHGGWKLDTLDMDPRWPRLKYFDRRQYISNINWRETWGSTLRSDLRITDGGMYIFDWWFHFGRPKLLSLFLYRFNYVLL